MTALPSNEKCATPNAASDTEVLTNQATTLSNGNPATGKIGAAINLLANEGHAGQIAGLTLKTPTPGIFECLKPGSTTPCLSNKYVEGTYPTVAGTHNHLETYAFNRADSIDQNGLPCFSALFDRTGKPVGCLLPLLPLCKTTVPPGGGLKCASIYYATYQINGPPVIIGSSLIFGDSRHSVAPWCTSSSGNCPGAPAVSKVEITWQYPGSPIITGLKFSIWVPGDGKAGMGRGP